MLTDGVLWDIGCWIWSFRWVSIGRGLHCPLLLWEWASVWLLGLVTFDDLQLGSGRASFIPWSHCFLGRVLSSLGIEWWSSSDGTATCLACLHKCGLGSINIELHSIIFSHWRVSSQLLFFVCLSSFTCGNVTLSTLAILFWSVRVKLWRLIKLSCIWIYRFLIFTVKIFIKDTMLVKCLHL